MSYSMRIFRSGLVRGERQLNETIKIVIVEDDETLAKDRKSFYRERIDMSAVRQHLKKEIRNFGKKLWEALPVILFFMVLFYTMLFFFGLSCLRTVSIATVIFKGNYRKRHSAGSLLQLIFLHLFLAVLAYAATYNYVCCILLNFLVPFWLIFMKSSQFNPMGYFSGLMTFTLLQLAPTDLRGFGMQMAAFSYALFYFFVVVYVYQRRREPLPEYQPEQKTYHKSFWNQERIAQRFPMCAFELKFALRMSIVLTLTFSYSMLSHADHAFWLPMNAFLLLRPMYEESIHRIKSRFVGTVAGCILLVMILPLLPGTKGHILFASVIVIGLYAATPGTWQQALCSTCFALSITTLAIAEKTALELRLYYVVIAVLVVLAVNKFIFPMSLKSQFWYNFQSVFHMQHSYLRILERALRGRTEYDSICDAQLSYHLVHEQIMQYLKEQEPGENDFYRRLLSICWEMVSEMEQMLVLVNAKNWEEAELGIWTAYIMYTDYILNQVQQMLAIKPGKSMVPMKEVPYQRFIDQEPQISLLMTRYSENLSRLYRMVCQNSLEKRNKNT